MGTDYGSSGSPLSVSNFNTPLLILFIHVQLFLVVPLGVFGGPEKDRCFVFGFGYCLSLPTDMPCQLEISWHYRHPLCVYRTQVRVIEQPDQVCFCCLLKT